MPDTCFMAPGLQVVLYHRFSIRQWGTRRHRAIRQCLMATEGDANTLDWRPPPIHGIAWLWRRNQSTARASAAFGNPLRRWHLTGGQGAGRIAATTQCG